MLGSASEVPNVTLPSPNGPSGAEGHRKGHPKDCWKAGRTAKFWELQSLKNDQVDVLWMIDVFCYINDVISHIFYVICIQVYTSYANEILLNMIELYDFLVSPHFHDTPTKIVTSGLEAAGNLTEGSIGTVLLDTQVTHGTWQKLADFHRTKMPQKRSAMGHPHLQMQVQWHLGCLKLLKLWVRPGWA